MASTTSSTFGVESRRALDADCRPPASAADVPAWVRTAVAAAPPEACTEVIEQATKLLLAADPGTDVVAVLRAALG